MNDAKFYTEILEQNKEQVRQAVTDVMMASIKHKFAYELPQELSKEVSEFVKAEIMPEVRAQLIANKEEMITQSMAVVASIMPEIAKALQKQMAENLARSYNLKKVVEALF